ncbi:MAG: prenyltransferase/squalene oxidase repeat-containing protein [Candidatus Brocadiia bacterium]
MDNRRGTTDDGRWTIARHLPSSIVHRLSSIVICGALALSAQPGFGGDEPMPGLDLSTKKDALRAVDQGIQWLKARQNADGSWPPSPQPAVSAFATRAILRDPARERGKLDASAAKGLEFIASCAQKDGGIYRDSASRTCSTTASVLALAGSRQDRYEPLILAARRFLVRGQNRRENSEQFGGWADSDPPADMRMTALAIEALAATQRLSTADAEKNHSAPADPDWTAAVAFLDRCQNLPTAYSGRPQDLGGFFNEPDKAGPLTPRLSEGSATALGLAALLESNVARSDPRVVGAVDWIRSNYTLDTPAGGPGKQGLCFYYYSLAGALSLYGEEPLLRPEKRAADWRRELMIRLISLQRTDSQGLGYWVNGRGEGAEKDPVLVTAWCVLTLETLADEPQY